MMIQLFKDTNYIGDEFVEVGLDLCKYQFEELVAEAMFLLHRYHSSFEDIFTSSLKTQVSRKRSKNLYYQMQKFKDIID